MDWLLGWSQGVEAQIRKRRGPEGPSNPVPVPGSPRLPMAHATVAQGPSWSLHISRGEWVHVSQACTPRHVKVTIKEWKWGCHTTDGHPTFILFLSPCDAPGWGAEGGTHMYKYRYMRLGGDPLFHGWRPLRLPFPFSVQWKLDTCMYNEVLGTGKFCL